MARKASDFLADAAMGGPPGSASRMLFEQQQRSAEILRGMDRALGMRGAAIGQSLRAIDRHRAEMQAAGVDFTETYRKAYELQVDIERRLSLGTLAGLDKAREMAAAIGGLIGLDTDQMRAAALGLDNDLDAARAAMGGLAGLDTATMRQAALGVDDHLSTVAATMKAVGGSFDEAIRQSRMAASLAALSKGYGVAFAGIPEVSVPRWAVDLGVKLPVHTFALPGFRSIAALGLDGFHAQGAIAEFLTRYEADTTGFAEMFAQVLGEVRRFDGEDIPEADEIEATIVDFEQRTIDYQRGSGDALATERISLSVQVFFAVLMLLIEIAGMAERHADRVHDRAVEAQAAEHQRTVERRATYDWRTLREVTRSAWLRAEPSGQGTQLRRLYSDDVVRVLERSGDWAQVEIEAYAGGRQTGWVHRSNLSPIRP